MDSIVSKALESVNSGKLIIVNFYQQMILEIQALIKCVGVLFNDAGIRGANKDRIAKRLLNTYIYDIEIGRTNPSLKSVAKDFQGLRCIISRNPKII